MSSKLSPSSLTERLTGCLESHGIVVDALYLFGSYARNEAGPSSDIDVLLISPSFAAQGFWTRCARVGEAISGLQEAVQIYPITPEEFRRPEAGGFLEFVRAELKPLRVHRPRTCALHVSGTKEKKKTK